MDVNDIIKALEAIGTIVARAPEFKAIYDTAVSTFNEDDQDKLKEAYALLVVENDEGFKRLDAKLDEAAKRG